MADVLTRESLQAELTYDPSSGIFTRNAKRGGRPIGSPAGHLNHCGYIEMNVCGNRVYAHRAAWLYVHGYLPVEIDHVNRIRSDNRMVNLREVSHEDNMLNVTRDCRSISGVTGVFWSKAHGMWHPRVYYRGKMHCFGYFKSKEEAIRARQENYARIVGCADGSGHTDRNS